LAKLQYLGHCKEAVPARGEENHEGEVDCMSHARRERVSLHVMDRDYGLVKFPAQVLRKLIPDSVVSKKIYYKMTFSMELVSLDQSDQN
jgi:hypothetical protein